MSKNYNNLKLHNLQDITSYVLPNLIKILDCKEDICIQDDNIKFVSLHNSPSKIVIYEGEDSIKDICELIKEYIDFSDENNISLTSIYFERLYIEFMGKTHAEILEKISKAIPCRMWRSENISVYPVTNRIPVQMKVVGNVVKIKAPTITIREFPELYSREVIEDTLKNTLGKLSWLFEDIKMNYVLQFYHQ